MNHDTFALLVFALTCVSLYPLFLFRPRMRNTKQRNVSDEVGSPATTA